jgi:hypothetical protein
VSSTITERVAAGAAVLDEHDPEWWKADVPNAIDLNKLDLRAGDSCVLGQRCPVAVLANYYGITVADDSEPDELASGDWQQAYHAYAMKLSGLVKHDHIADWGHEHGFVSAGSGWEYATAEWKRVIEARRSA